jgi:hypothetical protein
MRLQSAPMDNLISAVRKLAKESPLDEFSWDIPTNCPIDIPSEHKDGYSKNIFLKENLSRTILSDKSLASHYWSIQDWGGVSSFKKNEKNDLRINKFLDQLNKRTLTKNSFECISSLSKVAAFAYPDEYAIYDSRAIYSLNWLIFNHSKSAELFPQPIGRSAKLSKYDMQTIFRLTKCKIDYLSHKVAFHRYCELMKTLACEVFGSGSKPYKAEMLLFMVAPNKIISQVESSVSITITMNA